MIAIIDYEMGNIRSVQKAFEAVGHQAIVTRDPDSIRRASHVVLPGVGAFGDCMANLTRFGLVDPIQRSIKDGKPFLGICLGLQLLFTESQEFGTHRGLNIVKGSVKRFPLPTSHVSRLKVPHMGWNSITIKRSSPVLEGIDSEASVYFVHSYYVEPWEASTVCTTTVYGIPFVSSISLNNIFACQFHPEKSQRVGLKMLRNFGECRWG